MPADAKSPLKGAWPWSGDQFKFWWPNHIPGTAEARIVKFCTHVLY